ncbi:hypothetical protein PLICRDRAFT_177275 [Plicaturopsis crispa FD-325 SS-3]|nr:hypothetical protein PLICRDRAFT_177275 [Plicaturopsis crispa FD-325 SS-3]
MPKSKKKTLSKEEQAESHRDACAKYYLKNRRARISDVKERCKRRRDQGCLCRSTHRDPFCGICCPPEPPRGVSAAFTEESSSRVVMAAIESWANLRESGSSRWLPALDMEHQEAVEAGIAGAWASQLEEEIAEGERLLEGFVRWQMRVALTF